MNNKPVISPMQLGLLALGAGLFYGYSFMPILVSYPHNHDVWVSLLLSSVFIVLFNAPLIILINKFRGLKFTDSLNIVAGNIMGRVFACIFLLLFIMCYLSCMLASLQFVNITLLTETPMWAILLITLIPALYLASKGAGTLCRIAVFIVPVMIATIVVFFISSIELMEIESILPVLGEFTFLDILLGAISASARFSEMSAILIFSYYLPKNKNINKTIFTFLGAYILLLFLVVMPTILVLGYDVARLCFNPYFVFTRQVTFFKFIDRVQALNTLVWYPIAILKVALYCFLASVILSEIFNKPHKRATIIPFLGILPFILLLQPFIDRTFVVNFIISDAFFPWILGAILFIVPIIIILIYIIRHKTVKDMIERQIKLEEKQELEAQEAEES